MGFAASTFRQYYRKMRGADWQCCEFRLELYTKKRDLMNGHTKGESTFTRRTFIPLQQQLRPPPQSTQWIESKSKDETSEVSGTSQQSAKSLGNFKQVFRIMYCL